MFLKCGSVCKGRSLGLLSVFIIMMLNLKIHSSLNRQLVILIVLIINCISPLNAKGCVPCDMKPKTSNDDMNASYEEYAFEHQVTQHDAVAVLRQLNDSFYDASAHPACKRIRCDSKVMRYCLGPKFINDHCWCEQGHGKEGLPFIPHICYVGEKQFSATIGSCFFYSEVKECCCIRALAKQWKHLSAAVTHSSSVNYLLIYLLLLMYPIRYFIS